MQYKIVLASGSPRRAELLHSAGVQFEVVVPKVNEQNSETAEKTVLNLSRLKACAVSSDLPVLAADTVVSTRRGKILGKPESDNEARDFLQELSGDFHFVHTGYCIRGEEVKNEVVTTKVYMARLSDEQIKWYLSTGEARDKAGAYGIQGHAGCFISRIEGSYTNVVGLPLAEVIRDLEDVCK